MSLAEALNKFDPSEPRDDAGKWTSGGGGGGGEHDDDPLGPGYSDEAKLIDGVIHTGNVYDAVRALHDDRKVELTQPRQVSILLDKLGEISKQMILEGKKAPTFDLCNVTLKGTSLFCADAKGIPRVKMPQIPKELDAAFIQHLRDQGYNVSLEHQFANHLRATQNELNGAKVAGIARRKREGNYNEAPIFVSNDDYILDGHHRWAAEIGNDAADNVLGNSKKMPVSRVDIDIIRLLDEAEKFTEGKGKIDVGDSRKQFLERWRAVHAQARELLKFDPSQPRDDEGKWTSGGGGGGESGDTSTPAIPETFTPHNPPTPGEQRIVDGGNKVTRAKSGSMYPDEGDHFKNDLPLYAEHLNANTTYEFMQTPKGIATVALNDIHGADKPTVEIHWLIAHDRGAGRSAMELMTDAADKHGVTLQLYAVPLGDADTAGKKLSIPKLEKFYAGFGFKKFGRRDSDGYALMKRQPVKAKKAYDPSEPRDDAGKWTSGGGSEGAGTTDKPKGKKATKDDFDKAKIKINAVGMEQEKFLDTWNDKIGVDPATFKHDFMGGLDGSMAMSGTPNSVTIEGKVENDGGRTIGTFTRNIYLDNKTAYSAYFKLERDATGSDIGKKLLAGNVDTYQKLGIETVRVGANIDVGGYAWAKYGYVPTLSSWLDLRGRLEGKLGGGSSSPSRPQAQGPFEEAEDWDQLSSDVQDDVRDRWMRDSFDDFYRSEVDNWQENGGAKDDAKYTLAAEYEGSFIPDWTKDALEEARSTREENGDAPIPYTNQQLFAATALSYESNRGDGEDDPKIEFDDAKLQTPSDTDPNQMTLPGIEPLDPAQRLTQDMRDQIEKELTDAFNKQADDKAGDMQPPQHLSENVSEYQDEYWSHSMTDSEKLAKAIDYGMAYHEVEPPADEEEPQQEMELPKPEPAEDPLRAALQSNDPKSIWKVADDPRGKKLLLGTNWDGRLHLNDPEQMARFNKYVGRAA